MPMNTRKTKRNSEESEKSPRSIPGKLLDFLTSGPKDTAPQQRQRQPQQSPQPHQQTQPGTPHPARPAAAEEQDIRVEDDEVFDPEGTPFTSPLSSPRRTPLPGSFTSEEEDTLTETPRATSTSNVPSPPLIYSSDEDEDEDDSISSAASVRRAARKWGQGTNWNEPPETATTATTDDQEDSAIQALLARYPINFQQDSVPDDMTNPEGDTPATATGAMGTQPPQPTGGVPGISLTDWNAQREELQRLKRELDALRDPRGPRTVATQETKIPSYSGFSDDRAAEVWFQRAESVANQFGWTDQRFIEAASTCFNEERRGLVLGRKVQVRKHRVQDAVRQGRVQALLPQAV